MNTVLTQHLCFALNCQESTNSKRMHHENPLTSQAMNKTQPLLTAEDNNKVQQSLTIKKKMGKEGHNGGMSFVADN